MEGASSAIGIASLGIQVCQGLLSYYDSWQGYDQDISSTYNSAYDLSHTLILLKASLENEELDQVKKDRVKSCVQSCDDSLRKLSQKCEKLRKHSQRTGARQKAWAELRRGWYPFRASTLVKLQEIVADVRERLKLAVQVLQLEVGTTTQHLLRSVATDSRETAGRTEAIQTQVQLIWEAQNTNQFTKIVSWLSPSDPETNHTAACKLHEPQTGAWLLQCDQYQKWKAGGIRHLWLHGKAGCGKTVLCSTVIEDIRAHCASRTNLMHATFYFTFSDNQKQSYESLLRSLVAQLGWKEPGLSMLLQAHQKSNASSLGVDELERILLACVESYDELFVLMDALDESPEDGEVRQRMLGGLERIAQQAPNVRMFVTSREVTEVRESMQILGAEPISIVVRLVDVDIQRYLSTQLSSDRKLSKLDTKTRRLVEDVISRKADGMFRWAYCQLQELKKLKSTKPKYVDQALHALPTTLDETYERMLTGIDQMYRDEALTLLRWLAHAQSPPTLGELTEASIIDPSGEGIVDIANRGSLYSTLEILAGLVVCGQADDGESGGDDDDDLDVPAVREGANDWLDDSELGESDSDSEYATWSGQRIRRSSRVRLAHFSVKEYLESKRISQSAANNFFLNSAVCHKFIAQSCLTYIIHYSASKEKTYSSQDLREFPLLWYAARSWFYHSSMQISDGVGRETLLLQSEEARRDWLLVHRPDREWERPFEGNMEHIGSGLYYASLAGLLPVVEMLITRGSDVNAQGGIYSNALQAASLEGHEKVVSILLERGADVNAQGGRYSNALQAASEGGYEKVVSILLERGADINAQGGDYGNALQAASFRGDEKVVSMLLERGADINAQGSHYGNALQAASFRGDEKVVSMLLERGADINAQGGHYGNALQAASFRGDEKVVSMLLERGADINAQGGSYGNALQAASFRGDEKVVSMLLERGADVNAQGGIYGNALYAASVRGHEKVVEMLIAKCARKDDSLAVA